MCWRKEMESFKQVKNGEPVMQKEVQEHQHARFQEINDPDDQQNAHDANIMVEKIDEENLNVRLGFLQISHIYEVRFTIEDELGEDVSFDPLENLYVKVESADPSLDGKGHDMVLTFKALKEKIVQESVSIKSQVDESKKLVLTLHARVLGKGKGTPSLKNGVRSVGIDHEDESEISDWQGFN